MRAGWTCFHCAEWFADSGSGRAAARVHFGATPDWDPACIERRTQPDDKLLRLSREARLREHDALQRAQAAEDREEAAWAGRAADARAMKARIVDLEARLATQDGMLATLRRTAPTSWRAAWEGATGGGEMPLPGIAP